MSDSRSLQERLDLAALQMSNLADNMLDPEMYTAYVAPRKIPRLKPDNPNEEAPNWGDVQRFYRGRVDGHIVVWIREWAKLFAEAAEASKPEQTHACGKVGEHVGICNECGKTAKLGWAHTCIECWDEISVSPFTDDEDPAAFTLDITSP